jgi:hypothetical protein
MAPQDPYKVVGNTVFDTSNAQFITPPQGPEDPPNMGPDWYRVALEVAGTLDPNKITPEQSAEISRRIESLRRSLVPQMQRDISGVDTNVLTDIVNSSEDARKQLQSLDALTALLDENPNLTGWSQEKLFPVRRLAVSLGVGDEELQKITSAQEGFTAISRQMALGKRGELMSGQLSNQDVQILFSVAAALGNTEEGNRFIIAIERQAAERAIEREQFYRDYADRHGNLNGASREWQRYIDENSVIDNIPGARERVGGDWESLEAEFGDR